MERGFGYFLANCDLTREEDVQLLFSILPSMGVQTAVILRVRYLLLCKSYNKILRLCEDLLDKTPFFGVTLNDMEGDRYINWRPFHDRLALRKFVYMRDVVRNLQIVLEKDFSVKSERDSSKSLLRSVRSIPDFSISVRVVNDDFMDATIGYVADLWRQILFSLDFGDKFMGEECGTQLVSRDNKVVAFRKAAVKILEIYMLGNGSVWVANGIFNRLTFENNNGLTWGSSASTSSGVSL